MKANTLKDNLAKGLSIVSRAVASRSTLPVLGNILIATEGARLRLSATNLSMAITCWIGADVEEDGAITVPARTIVDVVSTIEAGDSVSLALNKTTQTLALKASGHKTEIRGIDAEEFPVIPRGGDVEAAPIEFEAAVLRDAIGKTVFCAFTGEARPVLTGVLVKVGGGKATFAATDGFRLAAADVSVSDGSEGAIIPAKSLEEVGRVLQGFEGAVAMRVAATSQAIFTAEDIEIVCQLLEGNYPNYESIIPKDSKFAAEVDAAELRNAVKAADIFARENDHLVRFTFADGGFGSPEGGLTLLGQSTETGSGEAKVAAVLSGALAGQPFEIAFNAKYVMDALDAHDGRCVMKMNSPATPLLIVPASGNGYRQIVMPMAVKAQRSPTEQHEDNASEG